MVVLDGLGWWSPLLCLVLALILSSAIGAERQVRRKSAGVRTHALVGLGAALFMVISKHGFDDMLTEQGVSLDPSRVAAQVVSGIGFIGAGIVFVQRNRVLGLTTASSIWLAASVGMAAGAGMAIAAVFVTVLHFVVVVVYPIVIRAAGFDRGRRHLLRVSYVDGTGALRRIAKVCTDRGFAILGVTSERRQRALLNRGLGGDQRSGEILTADLVTLELELEGLPSIDRLVADILELEDIDEVVVDGSAD